MSPYLLKRCLCAQCKAYFKSENILQQALSRAYVTFDRDCSLSGGHPHKNQHWMSSLSISSSVLSIDS